MIGDVGDPLGRIYTPDGLARAIVATIPTWLDAEIADGGALIDPCVGGGAFARAMRERWPGARLVVVDADPDAAGLALGDVAIVGGWEDRETQVRAWNAARDVCVIATNPPYTRDSGRRNKHGEPIAEDAIGDMIAASLAVQARWVSLLLPAATLFCGPEAGARWALESWPPYQVQRVEGRPWRLVREVAVYSWALDGGTSSPYGTRGTSVPSTPIRWERP